MNAWIKPAILTMCFICSNKLQAQWSTVDSTFSDDGIAIISAGAGNDRCYTSAVQSDGKLIIVGNSIYESGGYFISISRLFPDGTPDPAFGTGGIAIQYVNGHGYGSPLMGSVEKVLIQPDEKIVLVGQVVNTAVDEFNYDYFIMRLMPDGSRDATFGTDGFSMYGYFDEWGYFQRDYARSAALLPDGKIVIVGDTGPYGLSYASIMRILPNGLVDPTFGTDGSYFINVSDDSYGRGIAVLGDGSMVMSGYFFDGQYVFFAKWNADGLMDETFGIAGIQIDSTIAGFNLKRMAITPDEKFILMGEKNSTVMINRYTSEGIADTTFAYFELPHSGTIYYAEDLFIDEENHTYFCYHASNPKDYFLGKLTDVGGLDYSFNASGTAQFDLTTGISECQSVVMSGETLYASGYADFQNDYDIATIAVTTEGEIDNGFATDGVWRANVGRSADYGHAIALTPDNKILIAGNNGFVLVARVNETGVLDSTFGNNGVASHALYYGISYPTVTSVLSLPNGRIVVLAYDDDLVVSRLYPDGSLDPTFNGGYTNLTVGDEELYYTYDLAYQEDEKVLFSGIYYGYGFAYEEAVFLIGRLNEDGTFDSTFNGDGLNYDANFSESLNIARAIAVMPDDRIVAGGYYVNDNEKQYPRLVRYMPDGSRDNSFSGDGAFGATINGEEGRILDLKVDIENRIVGAGYVGAVENDTVQIMVMRVTADGELDTTFADGGYFIYDTPLEASARSIAVDDSNRIVVSGYAYIEIGNAAFFTLRLLSDGTPDPTFGINGMLFTDLTPEDDIAYSMQIQDDGKIILGGTSSENLNTNFALVRLLPENGFTEPIDSDTTYGSFLVFPNPIHGAFVLQYQLLDAQQVSIGLFDAAGNNVAQLMTNEARDAGDHQEALQLPETLARGYYFLRISCSDLVTMVQIVVM